MHLNVNGEKFAKVVQRLSYREKYDLVDMNDNLIASAKEKFFKLGTHYDIFDAQGNSIGSFDHELMKSFFSFKSKYCVRDQNGIPRLYTEELDFIGTDVSCYEPQKNLICTMKKPMFSLRDKWEVNIYGPADRRVIAMIPSFLTSIQNNREAFD